MMSQGSLVAEGNGTVPSFPYSATLPRQEPICESLYIVMIPSNIQLTKVPRQLNMLTKEGADRYAQWVGLPAFPAHIIATALVPFPLCHLHRHDGSRSK